MESPDYLQRFVFIVPLVLLPVVVILLRFPWRMALLVWFTGTLIQETALLIPGVPLRELPHVILTFYPFALFPLGLWSVILALGAWTLVIRLRRHLSIRGLRKLALAAIWGGVVGLAFAFVCAYLLQLIGSAPSAGGPTATQLWVSWELGGFCAGAADGVIIASFLPRDHKPLFRWARPRPPATSQDQASPQSGFAE